MLPPLPESAITIGAQVDDWRGAVRLAGDALARSGAATPAFADEMIRVIEKFGPYVVIAPGLALAHARPGPETLADGLSVVTLETPDRKPYTRGAWVYAYWAGESGGWPSPACCPLAGVRRGSSRSTRSRARSGSSCSATALTA